MKIVPKVHCSFQIGNGSVDNCEVHWQQHPAGSKEWQTDCSGARVLPEDYFGKLAVA